MESSSIETLHRTKTGKTSDKWASYLDYYDSTFSPLRNAPIRLLEIGVQNGGSLDTWSKYFANAEVLIGCDIDPKCGELRYDDPRVHVVVGDVNTTEAYEAITAISPRFDIVIDDGSHHALDIINAFINYFPLLVRGGIFIVEDAHTLYMNDYGGGVLNELSGYAFFKRLIDVVSYQFWRDELSINTYMRTFFDARATPQFILEGWIDSIEFRNSIITIKKALHAGHDKLGERLIVGDTADVKNLDGVAGQVNRF